MKYGRGIRSLPKSVLVVDGNARMTLTYNQKKSTLDTIHKHSNKRFVEGFYSEVLHTRQDKSDVLEYQI